MQLFAAIHEDDIAVILYAKGKAHIAFFACNGWLSPKTVRKKRVPARSHIQGAAFALSR